MNSLQRPTVWAALSLAAVVGCGVLAVGSPAVAAPRTTVPTPPATVTAAALPTWQIDGVVWDTVTVGTLVFATGEFRHARPPGTAASSPLRVARTNLLAFDITTGRVTDFAPVLDGPGHRIAASPDGSTVYVGGTFRRVDGVRRDRLAAFDVAGGRLVPGFAPRLDAGVTALTVSATKVFAGGPFTRAGSSVRRGLAAFDRGTGATLAWRPTPGGGTVRALALSGSRVIAGGSFQTMNGKARVGVGALDTVIGATRAWASRPIPSRRTTTKGTKRITNQSYVSDLQVADGVVYGTAVGDGSGWFDGRFAARAADGALVWLDTCYGATLSGYVTGRVFYSVGHAHDCSGLGAFGRTNPKTYYHALAETTYATGRDRSAPGVGSHYRGQPVPSLLPWFPRLTNGTFTGRNQAAWAITGNGAYVALAGEFLTVNGRPQQGLTRFGIRPLDPTGSGPRPDPALTPTAAPVRGGGVTVTWRATHDRDDALLTYTVQRRLIGTVGTVGTVGSLDSADWSDVATRAASSAPWRLPLLSVTDTGAPAGFRVEYRVVARDPAGNELTSGTGAAVTA